jgi:dUTP pyrophosphatase
MIKVEIINKSNNQNPSYETPGSAGVDLRAYINENGKDSIVMLPNETKLVHTGLYMAIPEGYEGQVRPRSGLALKHGITVLNTPGTIDSDYTGEICVILKNTNQTECFEIKSGERIAQMVVSPVVKAAFAEVKELKETERGDGGFGHTGTN